MNIQNINNKIIVTITKDHDIEEFLVLKYLENSDQEIKMDIRENAPYSFVFGWVREMTRKGKDITIIKSLLQRFLDDKLIGLKTITI